MEKEKYVGGIKSSNFKKMHEFYIGGYGIYVTDKRTFGIKGSAIELMKDTAKGGLLEILLAPGASSPLGREESSKAIEELENKKDIEILKKDVSEIEMKKPSALGFRGGYLKIRTKSGEPMEISIPYKKDFEKVKKLMEAFKPGVLKIV